MAVEVLNTSSALSAKTLATLEEFAASGGSALSGFLQAGTGAVARTVQAVLRDTIRVTDFGAVGNGSTDDYAAVDAARTYATSLSTGASLVFPRGTYKLSTSISFDADISPQFERGAMLSPDATKTATINGPIVAACHQIFGGAGSVVLTSAILDVVYPEWWGAVGDGSTDDAAAFTSALGAGGQLLLSNRTYNIGTTAFTILDKATIRGVGGNSILTSSKSSGAVFTTTAGGTAVLDLFTLRLTNSGAVRGVQVSEARNIVFGGGFRVESTQDPNTNVGVYIAKSTTYAFSVRFVPGVYLTGMFRGVDFADTVTTCSLYGVSLVGAQSGGAPSMAGSIGVNIEPNCTAQHINGCELEGWGIAIKSRGTYPRIIGNNFETNTVHLDVAIGAGNTRTWHFIVGNNYSGSGTFSVDTTNTTSGTWIDTAKNAWLHNVALVVGGKLSDGVDWAAVPFAAGNFTANGTMTWTVASGDQTIFAYKVVSPDFGNQSMKLLLELATTTVGGTLNTELRVTLPEGYKCRYTARYPCVVNNNGTRTQGVVKTNAAQTYLSIFCSIDEATNWTAATDTTGVSVNLPEIPIQV